MSRAILTLNAGSSSLKFAVYRMEPAGPALAIKGQVSGIGSSPTLTARDAAGAVIAQRSWPAETEHEALFAPVFDFLDEHLGEDVVVAVGHRIVHGGSAFHAPVVIDDSVLAALDKLCPLAPLHQPHNLAAVRAARLYRPDLRQVACFDTAFHHGHEEVVTRLALPAQWRERGVRRYGFHGLSYEYVSGRLRELDPGLASGRVLVAHLGNGASLCAVKDGRSIDSTMGFTALDGLMMGTRCGSIDPGVILYLQQEGGLSVDEVQGLLYEEAGLLGVSGLSSDMRVLLQSDEPEAKAAIDLFVFRAAREAGALISSMGGLNGLVFTAGIGENAAPIRAMIVERLGWTGLILDAEANAGGESCISSPSSLVQAWVIPTNEELMIARHTALALGQAKAAEVTPAASL